MSEIGRIEAVSIHRFRCVANHHRRRAQRWLDGTWDNPARALVIGNIGLPHWTHGVQVRKYGPWCWVLMATEFPPS